jgi:hypothetical protein
MRKYIRKITVLGGLALSMVAAQTASADASYGAGGNYTLYSRLVARHIGKQIPGNPNIVV